MEFERDVPHRGVRARRAARWPCTSRCAASGSCGTSRPASASARSRRISCPRRSVGASFPTRCTGRTAPLGEGSLQRFVTADFEQHYFTLYEDEDERWHDQLRRICVFDLLANNTDRKSGHCLLGEDGRIWAIDNALCFHAEFKLRTVIWEFGGEDDPARAARRRRAIRRARASLTRSPTCSIPSNATRCSHEAGPS